MDATRAIMFGGAIGIGGVLMLSMPNILPAAIAEEEPGRTLFSTPDELWPPAFNPDRLMRWSYYVQPGVSIDPLKETVVRKIAFGRSSFVNVMQTESGVYSTDGLASPNIQYPGIVKQPRREAKAGVWFWGDNRWVAAAPFSAGSFAAITPLNGAVLPTEPGNCIAAGERVYC